MKRRCSKGKSCAKKAEVEKCACGVDDCKCPKECPCHEKKKCPCGCGEGKCKCEKDCSCREKECKETKCPCGCEDECKCAKECHCREKECKGCEEKKCACGVDDCKCPKECPCHEEKKCPCGCDEGKCKCEKDCACREKECKETKCPCGCEDECKCAKECHCREKECKGCEKKCPCGCKDECKCARDCSCRGKECKKCPCGCESECKCPKDCDKCGSCCSQGKVVVATDKAPKAIGPYSQAIKANGMVFASGQIPLDPATGELHGNDSITTQTCLIFNNIEAILKEAGTDMSKVIKTTVFMRNMNDFTEMNEEYAKHFPADKPLPARSAVQVACLPKGVGLEVEVIALL